MAVATGLVAVIPAAKSVPLSRVLAAVAFTRQCREILRAVVVSDQPIEQEVAEAGAWFLPAPAGSLEAPAPRLKLLFDVGAWVEKKEGEAVRLLMHVDPERPMADPIVVFECLQRIFINAFADGVVGVRPGKGLAERDGWIEPDPEGRLEPDGSVFVFRTLFALEATEDWLHQGRFLPYHALPADAGRGGLM